MYLHMNVCTLHMEKEIQLKYVFSKLSSFFLIHFVPYNFPFATIQIVYTQTYYVLLSYGIKEIRAKITTYLFICIIFLYKNERMSHNRRTCGGGLMKQKKIALHTIFFLLIKINDLKINEKPHSSLFYSPFLYKIINYSAIELFMARTMAEEELRG